LDATSESKNLLSAGKPTSESKNLLSAGKPTAESKNLLSAGKPTFGSASQHFRLGAARRLKYRHSNEETVVGHVQWFFRGSFKLNPLASPGIQFICSSGAK
jgi:hypothetical protein